MAQALNNIQPQDDQFLLPIVQLLATGLEHEKFHAAVTAVLAHIAAKLDCSNASYGVYAEGHCSLEGSANSANLDQRMNLTLAATEAMLEAIDQDTSITLPQDSSGSKIVRAHSNLLMQANVKSVCTIPINHNGEIVGAFQLERQSDLSFDEQSIALCELIAGLIGPVLNGKRLEERPLTNRLADAANNLQRDLLGPQHATLKLLGGLFSVAVIILTIFSAEYRVTADATLEGFVQRTVTAPMDGYILEAHARAGDEVTEGDLLAVLDDRDLQLERSQWLSEQQKTQRSYRAALSQQDRSEVVILKSQLDQATTKLELAEEQLTRSRISAPLSGVLVSGDLSKSLGAPVERGEILFEVMPLTGYRVMLKVNERDIGKIIEQQTGSLALNGFPSERFAFAVTRITPVSDAEDGNNFFMVEAKLDAADKLLRPGMQGVAKIDAGTARIGWILTHDIFDWLRLWAWA